MSQYQQPGQPQPYTRGELQPAPQRLPAREQTVKFYKTWFFFASLAGKLERDLPSMEAQGWRLQFICKLGITQIALLLGQELDEYAHPKGPQAEQVSG